MHNIRDSLTSKLKITPDGLTCHKNKSTFVIVLQQTFLLIAPGENVAQGQSFTVGNPYSPIRLTPVCQVYKFKSSREREREGGGFFFFSLLGVVFNRLSS